MAKDNDFQPQFKPYKIYRQNLKNIKEFEKLTNFSYGLTLQLLFNNPKESLNVNEKDIVKKDKEQDLSYSPADISSMSVKLSSGWLDFESYGEKEGIDAKEVEELARSGGAGEIKIHPKTKKELILWPPSMLTKKIEDFPKVEKSSYAVSFTFEAQSSFQIDPEDSGGFAENQKAILSLVHSLGEPEQVSERASEILYRSVFLLHWTSFEVFLRNSVEELLRSHPSKLISGGKGKKSTLNYEELLELSNQLTSIDELRDNLVQKEIEKQQSDGKSVHGLINFLKSEFQFDSDPYDTWYVFKGKRLKSHYNSLIEVKDVRNAILHDAGAPQIKFFDTYPDVPRREDFVVIDDDYYTKSGLMLDSIAHSIARSIENGKYKPL